MGAQTAWKECYGKDLPEQILFGDSYHNIGVVWTPDSDGVAFPWKMMGTNTLYWWIMCTIPIVQKKISWANNLLGVHESALLVVSQQPWCTLSWDSSSSTWIEHKGNKCMFA